MDFQFSISKTGGARKRGNILHRGRIVHCAQRCRAVGPYRGVPLESVAERLMRCTWYVAATGFKSSISTAKLGGSLEGLIPCRASGAGDSGPCDAPQAKRYRVGYLRTEPSPLRYAIQKWCPEVLHLLHTFQSPIPNYVTKVWCPRGIGPTHSFAALRKCETVCTLHVHLHIRCKCTCNVLHTIGVPVHAPASF